MTETIKKDIHWTIEDVNYVIRNVPYFKETVEWEETISLDVSIKITALRDLMVQNEIQKEVDFETFNGIEFGK